MAAKGKAKAAASRGAAAKADKAKAAQAEVAKQETEQEEPQTVTVRGLTLELPAELPNTLLFDIAEMQENADAFTFIRTLTSFLGREQVALIRAKVARGEVPDDEFPDYLADILIACMEPFGISLGESPA